jgi:hypothetical protein
MVPKDHYIRLASATRPMIDWRRRWVSRHVELEIGNAIEIEE